jgi:hypothetical protein
LQGDASRIIDKMYDTCRCLSDEEACHHMPLLRRRIATSRHAQSDASPTQMLAPPSRILVRDALGPASPEGGLKGDDTRPEFTQSSQPFSLDLEAVPEPLWCRRSSAWTTSLHRRTTAGDAWYCFLSVMVALCHLGASLRRSICHATK